jgi:formylglycine-generating enzyme required for sulfatase activity
LCDEFNLCRITARAALVQMCVLVASQTHAQLATSDVAVLGLVDDRPASGRFVETSDGYMVPYAETIPGTDVTFEMIPVPGGEFLLGSPASEPGRGADEGPQVRVRVAPYWIGKCEVTWAEFRAYMNTYQDFKRLRQLAIARGEGNADAAGEDWQLVQSHAWNGNLEDEWHVDAVTSATPLYDASFTYSAGEEPNQPAVTMTPYAARQYTKWLSGITGREYRLPTEAEWEYAARAVTTTAFSFGDDPEKLGDHAWYDDNADYQTHPVGTKRPNPWGLHDMHGNVAEWTLDEYNQDAYQALAKSGVDSLDSVRWPTKLYPRVIRGGSWLVLADACRSAARSKSEDEEWKLSDPNIPLSPWWYTEEPATGVGMRIVRPHAAMDAKCRERAWEADVDSLREDVRDRLQEGRGAAGVADDSLPAATEAAKRMEKSP